VGRQGPVPSHPLRTVRLLAPHHRPPAYVCNDCRATSHRWTGRCSGCGAWNTLREAPPPPPPTPARTGCAFRLPGDAPRLVSLRDVGSDLARPRPTGVGELDRVLGGGVVAGSVTLLFGPPGIGKSTLLFQVLSSVAATGVDVMLASAEESLAQVGGRAGRMGEVPQHLLALEGPDVDAIEGAVQHHHPALVVVDSLQSISDQLLSQPAGTLSQVRTCIERLTRLAKAVDVPVFLVGHVTKDGDLAGPRAVEHLVDTVLSFDGDRHHALRVLTSVKHRFGPTGEVGIFEMRDDGLRAVPDPGPLMLGDRMAGVPGSVVVPVLQGRRPLLVEVQALLGPGTGAGQGARPHALGLDAGRVNLLMAVLACRTAIDMPAPADVFVAAVGGITVSEPAADLAVALALASVARGAVVPPDLVAFGELGLAGEVRLVPGADRRLAEAQRAGFTRALVPYSTPLDAAPRGLALHPVRTLDDALTQVWAGGPEAPTGTMPSWSTRAVAASR
jgi:DNA repair protein RadA/Sms